MRKRDRFSPATLTGIATSGERFLFLALPHCHKPAAQVAALFRLHDETGLNF